MSSESLSVIEEPSNDERAAPSSDNLALPAPRLPQSPAPYPGEKSTSQQPQPQRPAPTQYPSYQAIQPAQSSQTVPTPPSQSIFSRQSASTNLTNYPSYQPVAAAIPPNAAQYPGYQPVQSSQSFQSSSSPPVQNQSSPSQYPQYQPVAAISPPNTIQYPQYQPIAAISPPSVGQYPAYQPDQLPQSFPSTSSPPVQNPSSQQAYPQYQPAVSSGSFTYGQYPSQPPVNPAAVTYGYYSSPANPYSPPEGQTISTPSSNLQQSYQTVPQSYALSTGYPPRDLDNQYNDVPIYDDVPAPLPPTHSNITPISSSHFSGDALSVVTMLDGEETQILENPSFLSRYLDLFPEAENDQACRVFGYGPNCSTKLMMALFQHYDYPRYSLFPYGLKGDFTLADQFKSGSCMCDKCSKNEPCGHYVIFKNLKFFHHVNSTVPASTSARVRTDKNSISVSDGTT